MPPWPIGPLLTALLAAAPGPVAADDGRPATGPVFPPASQAEAWRTLPRQNPELPAWACALAPALPHGAAKLVELDDLHRTQSPLGPGLRAKLRWAVADANGCEYGKAYAAADLKKAGGSVEQLATPEGLPADERAALAFARTVSKAAHKVTDGQFADLVTHFGNRTAVGIVHTVAYANFQDRLLLGLRTELEKGGPLPPVGVEFDLTQIRTPEAPPSAAVPGGPAGTPTGELKAKGINWAGAGLDLAQRLEAQKNRKPRVPLVGEDSLRGLPERLREQAKVVAWSNISMGYQPRLTGAWFASMAAAQSDARFEKAFSNSVFWVVTRSNQCFY